MADELEPGVVSMEGEGPSAEFVANLRDLVLAELAESEVDLVGGSVIGGSVIDDSVITSGLQTYEVADATTRRPRVLAGLAAASVALIVGFVLLSRIGQAGKAETVTVPDELRTSTKSDNQELRAVVPPPDFAAGAERLEGEFRSLEVGTYRVDTVGTPFSFMIDETLYIQDNSGAFVALTHVDSVGADDREIVLTRLTTLLDPARPEVQLTGLGQGWPADDFDGWLDNLSDVVWATNRMETTLGGLAAIRVDIEVDESACGLDEDFCVSFFSNGLGQSKSLNIGVMYRVWIVDQGQEDPLTVIASFSRDSHSDWFDVADEILSTLVFGDIGANPVLRRPAGPSELSLFGGIRLEFATEKTVLYETANYVRILHDDVPADVELLDGPLDLDGNAIHTTDELVAVLRESSIEVTELEPTTVGGFDARVFGIVDGAPGPAMLWSLDDEPGWRPPSQGQLWLIEHPERGLLMINAEAGSDAESVFPVIVAETEKLVASLEFVDLG